MRTSGLLVAFAMLAIACAPSTTDRVRSLACAAQTNPAAFCSSACAEARDAASCSALWQRVTEVGSTASDCLDACFVVEVCPSPMLESQLDCDCYADCMATQSDQVQDAVVDALECERPPACR